MKGSYESFASLTEAAGEMTKAVSGAAEAITGLGCVFRKYDPEKTLAVLRRRQRKAKRKEARKARRRNR